MAMFGDEPPGSREVLNDLYFTAKDIDDEGEQIKSFDLGPIDGAAYILSSAAVGKDSREKLADAGQYMRKATDPSQAAAMADALKNSKAPQHYKDLFMENIVHSAREKEGGLTDEENARLLKFLQNFSVVKDSPKSEGPPKIGGMTEPAWLNLMSKVGGALEFINSDVGLSFIGLGTKRF